MAKTTLLPPVIAVRLAWAITGKFSNDAKSGIMATYAEDSIKSIEEQAKFPGVSPEEKSYVTSAIAAVRATMRSLETVYKGRELNFKENEDMRKVSMAEIQDKFQFGKTMQDTLKSLPAMTIGGAGSVTVLELIGIDSKLTLGMVGLLTAALGYLVNMYFVYLGRRSTQMLYVTQDYERDLYYDQYVSRVHEILLGLFFDIERIHKRIFQENYENDISPSAAERAVKDILDGIRSTLCPYAHRHMRDGKITPELWSLCESGHDDAVSLCPLWEGTHKTASSPG
jgi:hypothetical protein